MKSPEPREVIDPGEENALIMAEMADPTMPT